MKLRVKQVNGYLICLKHNKKIKMVTLDNQIPFLETMYCSSCLDEKQTISNNIYSIKQVQNMINEKYQQFDQYEEDRRQKLLQSLTAFVERMINARSLFLQMLDEILQVTSDWITNLKIFGEKPEQTTLIKELEQLQRGNATQQIEKNLECQKTKEAYLMKINLTFQKLLAFEDFQKCSDYMKSINTTPQKTKNYTQPEEESTANLMNDQVKPDQHTPILIQNAEYKDQVHTMQFNSQGSILLTGSKSDIKVWSFDKGNLIAKQTLKTFSSKINWFATGSFKNQIIQCWKEQENNQWIKNEPGLQNRNMVPKYHDDDWHHEPNTYKPYTCLILNSDEDKLISCSGIIKIWSVNCQENQIQFDYILEKQEHNIFSISLNESETALVSCSEDKRITLWMKESNKKWQYKTHVVKKDIGKGICFVSDRQIAWQQCRQGFTQVFEIQNGNLIKKPELKISLGENDFDIVKFPIIFYKAKQIMILKNGCIFTSLENTLMPIGCNSGLTYGALTQDGEYLIIWFHGQNNFRVCNELRVYKIQNL